MIHLQRVEQHDIPTLTEMKKRAFQQEFQAYGFTPEDMIAREWHEHMMEQSLYYTIMYNGKCIGGVNIFQGEPGEYYLCSLFIDAEYQNKGFGTQALEALERLHDDGKKWGLETPSMSVQNHHFYEKCGYTYVRDMIPDGAPEGFSLWVYEKLITDGEVKMEPKIVHKDGFAVIGLKYHGKNENDEIPQMWGAFGARASEIKNIVNGNVAYGISANMDETGEFDYVAGYEVSSTENVPGGMVCFEVPGGKYAVFTTTLPKLGEAFQYAYSTWLPQSDYQPTGSPDFELYGEYFDPRDPSSELAVYIPIQ
jgi:predicted transcriptional regulator YdeE/GNAT superfamily N-acetyltransferase